MKLHVYRNDVAEWFVAESPEEAAELARKYLAENCGINEEDMDLDFCEEPDNKTLTLMDVSPNITKTCEQWAEENGKGFLFTTEY